MQEMIKNAMSGWTRYTEQGKYAVLFLGALVILWALVIFWAWQKLSGKGESAGVPDENSEARRKLSGRKPHLLIYASVIAVLAIFPLTAAVLMKYQTSFYDYEWIWSSVPVTLVIAWGMTEVFLKNYRMKWRRKKHLAAGFAGICLVIVFLCGNMGQGMDDRLITESGEEKTSVILDKLDENGYTQNICLWAPAKLMQYVRGIDGNIRLLYGRNMWEPALNAYSYDTYDDAVCKLYEWMEQLTEDAAAGNVAGADSAAGTAAEMSSEAADQQSVEAAAARVCMETALFYGVNCIVVPQECEAFLTEIVTATAAACSRSVEELAVEEYHIYRILE